MKDILKRFFLFLIVLLFLEVFFSFVIFNNITFEKIINFGLYSVIISAFLSIITGIFSSKVNNIITVIILFIIGVLFSVQIVFYNVYKVFASFSMLGLGDQLASFLDETIQAIIDNIFYIIITLLPFIIYLIIKKKVRK